MSPNVLERFSLANKTVALTGATGGIGREMAIALAEAGADIVSFELPNDPLAKELHTLVTGMGRRLSTFECNVREPASIEAAFAALWKSDVIPDVLINVAGITCQKSIEDTTAGDIDAVMGINFRGTFLMSQMFGRKIIELGRKGKIINFGSMAAQLVQTDIAVYASSKAAIHALARAFSNEWAGKGVTCNAISPGFVRAGMCTSLFNDREFERKVEERTSLGRWEYPDDLKGLLIYLASSSSDFMTGESVIIDGGVIGR
ncbi:hypothetical protein QQS21_006775 [Conoideocrella luteorostrata]|uniref:Uncharacterized protein n=1 Tax=Conoideocrella luteorostrata TaxID=1105319 RepID=A0AAJ0FZZ0_9HYPO|nr:hypothetical protein QQS21_006775 [Conoideocrella luteorostrata]